MSDRGDLLSRRAIAWPSSQPAPRLPTYGSELRRLRRASGKTIGDVSRHLGLPTPVVSKAENGKHLLSGLELAEFCRWLGIDPEPLAQLAREVIDSCAHSDLLRDAIARADAAEAEVARLRAKLAGTAQPPTEQPIRLQDLSVGAVVLDADGDKWTRTDGGAEVLCRGKSRSVLWPDDDLGDALEHFGPFRAVDGTR